MRRARSTGRCAAAAALALLLARLTAAAGEPPRPFDPLDGIEPDGRIPYAERPADLAHPERWRYIPEGRIKPGGFFDRLFYSSMIAPFFFKSSDAGYGGGLASGDIDFRQQRRREFLGLFGSYTTERQQSYGAVWRRWLHQIELPEGGVLQEERSAVRAFAGFRRTRTRRFFGLGSGTNERDESSYTDQVWQAEGGFSLAVPEPAADLVLSGSVRGEIHRLSGGIVRGEPDTKVAFETLFRDARRQKMLWIQPAIHWDTRDSQSNPYAGWDLRAAADAALLQSGGDVGARFELSASRVLAVPGLFHAGGRDEENPPTDTLVLGLRTRMTAGELPFFDLPSLGGGEEGLRGFIAGRFRDRSSWHASAEYRVWVLTRGFGFRPPFRVERVGVALFYDPGSVARDFSELFRARVHHSWGVSAILSLERALPFRVNLGFSTEGLQLTAGFGLAF